MKKLHVLSHTHWDREWYMSFEKHRYRLVKLFDLLINIFDTNPNFKHFHMDGQVAVFEDYLEIRPHQREKIRNLINEGKISIGPWYILQDEFLISGESNIRNMLYGMKIAKEFGDKCSNVGYFPDTFGNIAQMPQILKGFGIDSALVGRGIEPFRNEPCDNEENVYPGAGFYGEGDVSYEYRNQDYKSEVKWVSPDGSEVICVLLPNWYNNAMFIPNEKDEAINRINSIKKSATWAAETPHLLFMNGSDHTPVQKDIGDVIAKVSDCLGDDVIVHTTLEEYIEHIRPYSEKFLKVHGELISSEGSGRVKLVNTASARIYLKQLSNRAQNLLERKVEPIGVMGHLLGHKYDNDFILYSWKELMKNHPHDSICGCSIDIVHDEMVMRYNKSIDVSNSILNETKENIVSKIDFSHLDNNTIPVVIMNTSLNMESDQVTTIISSELELDLNKLYLVDDMGKEIMFNVKALGKNFTYKLPDQGFRIEEYFYRYELKFNATNIQPMGYSTYYLKKGRAKNIRNSTLILNEYGCENKYISLKFNENGSFNLLDKATGKRFNSLNVFEDCGDRGNQYIFMNVTNPNPITTVNDKAVINIIESEGGFVTYKVENIMFIPKDIVGSTTRTEDFVNNNLPLVERSKELVKHKIVSLITVNENRSRVDIKVTYDNRSRNHRLRALFETNVESKQDYIDGHFMHIERDIEPWKNWTNPSNCERQVAFGGVVNEKEGLIVSARGLQEYEVLRDGKNTYALTILRANGEFGDWGDFPNQVGGQCIGENTVEYSVIPVDGNNKNKAIKSAYTYFYSPLEVVQGKISHGTLPANFSLISVDNSHVVLSAIKKNENNDNVIVRIYNPYNTQIDANFILNNIFTGVNLANLKEQHLSEIKLSNKQFAMTIKPYEIINLELIVK